MDYEIVRALFLLAIIPCLILGILVGLLPCAWLNTQLFGWPSTRDFLLGMLIGLGLSALIQRK
jgi:sulfite exporter TauE/SafE